MKHDDVSSGSSTRERRLRLFRLTGSAACFLVCLLLSSGCASVGLPGAGSSPRAGSGGPMWELPPEAVGTQSLYRIQYQGPEGNVGLKLTLYLAARDHFRMDAADSLGRQVWSLAVEPGDRAVWLDYRQKVYCRVYAAGEQSFVPIAHLPLGALPKLILGRMPAEPSTELAAAEGKISYRDAQGNTWNAQGAGDRLSWWTLLQDGEPVAWWRDNDGESIFSDRRGGQQVRWRLQVQEAMGGPLRDLDVPDTYREGACGGWAGDTATGS